MTISLDKLPLSGKVLLTLFLILLWSGYIMAALNARLSVGLSAGSIAGHYGENILTQEEAGDLEKHGFAEEEVDIGNELPSEHNESITSQEMVQLGHVHMLGFSLLFISLGIILMLSNIGEGWKVIILSLLFLFFLLDITGLFLVRFVSVNLAAIPFTSGIGIGAGIVVISLIALYDMWVRDLSPKSLSP